MDSSRVNLNCILLWGLIFNRPGLTGRAGIKGLNRFHGFKVLHKWETCIRPLKRPDASEKISHIKKSSENWRTFCLHLCAFTKPTKTKLKINFSQIFDLTGKAVRR